MTHPHHDAARSNQRRRREGEVLAPSNAATVTSRPVLSWPSVCRITRPRNPFSTRTCWVSAMPSSHGSPACFMEESGEAPVPPSWPGRWLCGRPWPSPLRRDGPDPHLGDEPTLTPGRRVGVLEVVDELRQVFDRVDVVVGRRRDKAHAWRRVPYLRYVLADLVPRQLAALARLDPWAILICNWSALTRYSVVTPKRPLATCFMALRRLSPFSSGREPHRVLATLARVGLAAYAVHRDGQSLVRLLESEPSDIAPVVKRLTISRAGSTSER